MRFPMTKRFLVTAVATCLFMGRAALAQQPATAPSPVSTGDRLFTTNCGGCHGYDLEGASGPSLFADALLSRRTDDMLLFVIRNGRAGTRMPPWKAVLTDEKIGAIIAYMRSENARLNGRPTGGKIGSAP